MDALGNLFEQQKDNKRRVIIIDYNHLAYRYVYGGARGLSVNRLINGVMTTVDTTIPAYTIKQIVRWSNFGVNPTIVCMDSPVPSRRYYFKQLVEKEQELTNVSADYKGDRRSAPSDMLQSMSISATLMKNGGIYVYQQQNYEADDLIFEAVQKAKRDYPYLPIDIITGDADMIPLVDEQVSVYMKSKVHTYAEEGSPMIKGYVQYTPDSYQEFAESLSKFKSGRTVLSVPYNTILLAKILRGDNADGLKGKPDWKPLMYNKLIDLFIENDEPIEDCARYGVWESTVTDKRTNQIVTEWKEEDIPHLFQQFHEPKELTQLLELVGSYCDDEDVEFVRDRYIGMCLNGAFLDVPQQYKRKPFKITDDKPFTGYNINKLQDSVSVLDIRLPMG